MVPPPCSVCGGSFFLAARNGQWQCDRCGRLAPPDVPASGGRTPDFGLTCCAKACHDPATVIVLFRHAVGNPIQVFVCHGHAISMQAALV